MRLLFGNGLLARQIAEHQSSGQFCFFDPRNSGFLDEVRYYDSSFKEGTPPEKVDLLAYTPLTMVPVSASEQDEVRLTVTHIGRHSMEIGLKIIQVGLARVFTTITSEGFTAGRTYKIGLDMPLPQAEDYFGVDFEVVAVDHDAKSVKIRFPENFDKNRVLVIPEETKIHYCFGYACPKN